MILQVTPVVSVVPFILIYAESKLVGLLPCAWIVAFPILANTSLGLKSTDHNLRNLLFMCRASRRQRLRFLELPSALPFLLGGLRIGGHCDLDMLEVMREAMRLAHLDHADPDRTLAFTANPARACGFAAPSPTPCCAAREPGPSSSRAQHDRVVLRGGCAIDRALPDHAELDAPLGVHRRGGSPGVPRLRHQRHHPPGSSCPPRCSTTGSTSWCRPGTSMPPASPTIWPARTAS